MKLYAILFASFCSFLSVAQVQGDGGIPKGAKVATLQSLAVLNFNEPNISLLKEEDAINDVDKAGPWRFGYNHETQLTMENAGQWYNSSNGGKIWLLKIHSKKAQTINLSMENVQIPAGNELYVYNEDKSFILGKFTNKHLYNGELGTELIPGAVAIVEYYVAPENLNASASLTISKVTHGYRSAKEFEAKAFGGSQNCNMNVNCPDGTVWGDQKRAVVMLVTNGNGFCTGSMINNTANDGKPYVLTANHCYSGSATNWVFRFHWESATCANPSSSPTFQSLSGAVLRARRTPTDFCLVEITGGLENGTVPSSINTFFAGWNKSGVNPTSTVGIHHPSGDIKKISFDDNAATPVQEMNSTEANSSWRVSWDRNTTTEGGSSGSPLFDQDQRIIGQLWGGGASCNNLSAPDYYGRISQSWEPAGSNSTNQLKYWLDPANSGEDFINGYDPNQPTVAVDAAILNVSDPQGTYCTNVIEPKVMIKNFGTAPLTSLTLTYGPVGGATEIYNWTGNLASGASELVTLPVMTFLAGNGSFNVTSSLPNGIADENTVNDSRTVTYTAMENAIDFSVTIRSDCYGSESTWEILNSQNAVLLSGGPFSNAIESISNHCLPEGCYTFKMKDSYGDGLSSTSSNWPSCTATNVGYWVKESGNTLVSMMTANFGYSTTHIFCLGSAVNPCDGGVAPTLTTTSNPSSGSNGSASVIATGGSTPYTYAWTGPNGFTASTASISNLASGNYVVTVTDNCSRSSTQTVAVLSSVGITGVQAGQFTMYPNPSNGMFTLEFAQSAPDGYVVSIYDLTGRAVYQAESHDVKKTINLQNVNAGKYILNVRSSQGSFNQSLVIKK